MSTEDETKKPEEAKPKRKKIGLNLLEEQATKLRGHAKSINKSQAFVVESLIDGCLNQIDESGWEGHQVASADPPTSAIAFVTPSLLNLSPEELVPDPTTISNQHRPLERTKPLEQRPSYATQVSATPVNQQPQAPLADASTQQSAAANPQLLSPEMVQQILQGLVPIVQEILQPQQQIPIVPGDPAGATIPPPQPAPNPGGWMPPGYTGPPGGPVPPVVPGLASTSQPLQPAAGALPQGPAYARDAFSMNMGGGNNPLPGGMTAQSLLSGGQISNDPRIPNPNLQAAQRELGDGWTQRLRQIQAADRREG